MKFTLSRILAIFLFTNVASGYSLDSFVKTMNQAQVSSLEEALRLLPSDLKTKFTLQYQGHGLQEASAEFPRVIMFGDDAKFIATFNGSESQGKYNSIEILQYNDDSAKFELYDLQFPLKRDQRGHIIMPEKNPAACLSCHAQNPHPIWGRYNFWAGMFGAHDDKLTASESDDFRKFMNARIDSPRYQVLTPLPGSEVSPLSSSQVETMSFRPNTNLGIFLARLNALKLAREFQESGSSPQLAMLLSPGMFNCMSSFTQQELERLEMFLNPQFASLGFLSAPVPDKKIYEVDNLVYLMGSDPMSWGMTSAQEYFDPFYLDNLVQTTPNYFLGAISQFYFEKYPELKPMYHSFPLAAILSNHRLVQTPEDQGIVKLADQILIPLALNARVDCQAQLNEVRKVLLK